MTIIKKHEYEIWCQLILSKSCEKEVHDFFIRQFYIDPRYLVRNMHITLYHSRRPMFNLEEFKVNCNHVIDTMDTRFMVLAPGGENPHPDLIPAYRKVGVRIKKGTDLRIQIDTYREEVLRLEDKFALGGRKPSNKNRNAFGSRYFQPHLTILKSGSGIKTDLTEVGEEFRDFIHELNFTEYIIKRKKLK